MNRRTFFKKFVAGSVVAIPGLTVANSHAQQAQKTLTEAGNFGDLHRTMPELQFQNQTERIQTLLQCYDKGFVSAQTILEELDLDFDAEVKKVTVEKMRVCGVNI